MTITRTTTQNRKKDYLFNTLGGTFNSFLSLFFLVIVTRINGITDSGLFSFAFGMSLTFFAIALYGGRTYQVSDINSKHKTSDYILLKIATSTICFLVALIFIIANQYDIIKSCILLSLVIYKILDALSDVYYGILQKGQQLYVAGKSQLYKSITALVVFWITDFLTHNLLLSSAVIVIVNLLYFLGYDVVHAHRIEHVKLSGTLFRHAFTNSKVLLLASTATFYFSFIQSMLVNVPRYFIEHICPEQQGVYGIVIIPATLIVMVMWFILGPETVRIARYYTERKIAQLCRVVRRIVTITVSIGLITLIMTKLLAGPIFSLIYQVDLNQSVDLIVLVVASGIWFALAIVYAQVLTVIRIFKYQIVAYTTTFAVQIGLTFVCVTTWQLVGALWAYFTINAMLFLLFMSGWQLQMRKVLNKST